MRCGIWGVGVRYEVWMWGVRCGLGCVVWHEVWGVRYGVRG